VALGGRRGSEGQQSLVSSRALLWTWGGLAVVSVLIATFVTLPAARR
jgi:hypothetical protein